MDSSWTSIVGTLVGGLLSIAATYGLHHLQQKAKKEEIEENIKKERSYLAILVLAYLDQFRDGCAKVAFDDGTLCGRPAGKDGSLEIVEDAPVFEPLSLDVNWKVLPADLMSDILFLPEKTRILKEDLRYIWENNGFNDDFFVERQYGYAGLALEVFSIARRLRQHAGLQEIVLIKTPNVNKPDLETVLKEKMESLRICAK